MAYDARHKIDAQYKTKKLQRDFKGFKQLLPDGLLLQQEPDWWIDRTETASIQFLPAKLHCEIQVVKKLILLPFRKPRWCHQFLQVWVHSRSHT